MFNALKHKHDVQINDELQKIARKKIRRDQSAEYAI